MDHPRVLVVEDELLIAMDVEDMVQQLGCELIASASSVAEALSAVRDSEIDGAVLDINLGSERSWPVAQLLTDRHIPFVLASGYDEVEVPPPFGNCPLISKPLSLAALRTGLQRAGILDGA